MIPFIWLLGYLFTLGFSSTKPGEGFSVFDCIITFLLWPIILGNEVRKALS